MILFSVTEPSRYTCDEYEEDLYIGTPMAWTEKKYSNNQYNEAAHLILNKGKAEHEKEAAYEIVNNWRAAHGYPLNTFQIRLRAKARLLDKASIVAQRTKRLSSINHKLERFSTMKLCQIQDIGGCRAILNNINMVNELARQYRACRFKHRLVKEDNYIDRPKSSGYRGIHLIYAYVSDKGAIYNGLKIEIQIRSLLQHAWATAVETVDAFTRQSLKSSQGEADWLRFFTLMGSIIAAKEKSPLIQNTPTELSVLKDEVRHYESILKVRANLRSFGSTLKFLEQPINSGNAHYYLIELDFGGNIRIKGYSKNTLVKATEDYLKAERDIKHPDSNVVLVSADSMDGLRRAYPNYFLDTRLFLQVVDEALK